jgi:hypothetical protein
MARVLRLRLLAPDIVEAVLEGKKGAVHTPARVLEPFPVENATRANRNAVGLPEEVWHPLLLRSSWRKLLEPKITSNKKCL